MNSLLTEQHSVYRPAAMLVMARIANVAVGLASIPVLIHFLGGDGFAAWAMLLAISAACTALELGMAPAFVKHAAPRMEQRDWHGASEVLSASLFVLAIVFLLGGVALHSLAPWAARRLQLPDTPLLDSAQLIGVVYVAIALRSLLQFGGFALSAARRFRAFAIFSFAQALSSNLTAGVVAIATNRLDLTLLAYWGAQLVSLAACCLLARRLFRPALKLSVPRWSTMRELLPHGLNVQASEWAQIVNFQFDKFLIAAVVGLWGVAPYEVANRSILALRSIPSSALDSFLPSAAIGQSTPEDVWQRYLSTTRLATIAVMVFMLAPLAIAPVFLYAWTGQMGYLSRGVFVGLSLGFMANVLALPAASMVQAAGRADIQGRAAVLTMLINIPLSLILLFQWGMTGAALGTSAAMIVGAALLMLQAHRSYGRRLGPTLAIFAEFWPALAVCVILAVLSYYSFEHWISGIHGNSRYAWRTRVAPAVLSGIGYLACLGTMFAIQMRRGMLSAEHRADIARWWRERGTTASPSPDAP